MACFDGSMEGKSFYHQESSKSNCADDSAVAEARPSANACFDCSICLDFAVDPVVTLCGHLYCWPCIYKWLRVQTATPQQCPVCKSPLSENALVPLYGRGNSNLTSKDKGLAIPSRPAVLGDMIASVINEQHSSALPHRVQQQQQQESIRHHRHYCPSPWGGMGAFGSTAGGVLGGLGLAILPLVARSDQGVGEMYLSRLNHLMPNGSSASRRRQERRVEDSLHQIWVFLFCCAVLGLLFF